MTRFVCTWMVALVVLGSTHRASAQEAAPEDVPASVTLDDLFALVDASPRLLAAQERADADLGDVTTAGTPQNPIFQYDVWGLIWGQQTNGGSQQQIAVTQTFPWPGQLDARVAAARAQHTADRALVDLARALTRLEVRRLFVSLLAAQEREQLLTDQEAAIESVAGIIRGRAEAGAGRRWDALRSDAELASIRAAHDSATADRMLLSGRLAILLGRPGWSPAASGTWADLPPLETTADGAPVESHTALEAAQRAREAAELAVSRERADAFPSFDLRLGTLFSTWPEGGYLYGGFAIPLPFIDQNQGDIERAEHELRAARATEDATQRELTAAIEATRAALAQRRAALADFDTGVMDRLPDITAMAEAAYRGGEIEVFELLDAVRSTRALIVERLEREQAVRHAEVDLAEAALGVPPP